MLVIGLMSASELNATYAADSLSDIETTPSINERLTKATIKGTLMNIKGEYYNEYQGRVLFD